MSSTYQQTAELVRLLRRVQPYFGRILIAAVLVAVVVAIFDATGVRQVFESEAIALVRAQPVVSRETAEGAQAQSAALVEPLDVTDYVMLVMSDGVLSTVAQRFNESFGPEEKFTPVSVPALRRQLTAVERLELKTPYAVEYYPTITLTATGYTPEESHRLLETWVGVIKERTHEVTFSAKEETLAYLEKEYETEKTNLIDIENEYNAIRSESDRLLDELQLERASLEQEYAEETVELVRQLRADWETRIAAKAAEANVPGLEAKVLADTMKLEGLKAANAQKDLEIIVARNRVHELEQELGRQTAANGEPDKVASSWMIRFPADPPLFSATAQTSLQELGAVEESMILPEAVTEAPEAEAFDPLLLLQEEELQPRDSGLERRERLRVEARERAAEESTRDSERPVAKMPEAITPVEQPQVKTTVTRQPPDLTPRPEAYLESVEVSNVGSDPNSVLLQRKLAEARVTVVAGPKELAEMRERVIEVQEELARVHGEVAIKRSELKNMEQSKEAALSKLTLAREYGQKAVERRSDYEIAALSRERSALEEQANRQFVAQEEVFNGLARDRLDAKLAVANTIDEVKIISPATYPENLRGASIIQVFFIAFAVTAFLLFMGCLAFVFLREIYDNVMASVTE